MSNKDIVINFFKAMDNNDFVLGEKLLGPHHQMHSTMSPVPLNAEQHLAMAKIFHESFSNGSHDLVDILEIGKKVVARGIWEGIHTNAFNGIPATGKTVRLSFITIVEIEEGAMKNDWTEMDIMSLMIQIGAIPAPVQS